MIKKCNYHENKKTKSHILSQRFYGFLRNFYYGNNSDKEKIKATYEKLIKAFIDGNVVSDVEEEIINQHHTLFYKIFGKEKIKYLLTLYKKKDCNINLKYKTVLSWSDTVETLNDVCRLLCAFLTSVDDDIIATTEYEQMIYMFVRVYDDDDNTISNIINKYNQMVYKTYAEYRINTLAKLITK